VELVEELS
jgi:hypothetical protein